MVRQVNIFCHFLDYNEYIDTSGDSVADYSMEELPLYSDSIMESMTGYEFEINKIACLHLLINMYELYCQIVSTLYAFNKCRMVKIY